MKATRSSSKNEAESQPVAADKPKVVRRDPAKRREQNRRSQQIYREKQRRRIEELERQAASASIAQQTESSADSEIISADATSPDIDTSTSLTTFSDTLDPSSFNAVSSELILPIDIDIASLDFDRWFQEIPTSSGPPLVFFNCGCPTLHVPAPTRIGKPTSIILPITPMNVYQNNLRIDVWCVLAAIFENCLHLGIPKQSFCSDESESPFFRPSAPQESSKIVTSMRSMTATLKYDLRPLESQITKSHHPYIDVLPWRDLRENLIDAAHLGEIDEDEFLHDFFNHVTCWGGVQGAKTGSPWDGRSWEASELFLRKWGMVIGGDDGELTRQSRWWRTMRGESVIEVA